VSDGIWTLPDGTPLKFQYGDHVTIDVDPGSPSALRLPFLSGYVRGYDAVIEDGGSALVAYTLYSVGNNPLHGVKEERLKKTVGRFGIGHGQGAHADGKACHLCGANL
jgi:hypothetical protein